MVVLLPLDRVFAWTSHKLAQRFNLLLLLFGLSIMDNIIRFFWLLRCSLITSVLLCQMETLHAKQVWSPILQLNQTAYPQRPNPIDLATCLNRGYAIRNMSLEDFFSGRQNDLAIAGVWWSERPSTVPVTVITQASGDRLGQLEAQCRSWGGPLSAAIYLPLYQPSAGSLTMDNLRTLQSAALNVSITFDNLQMDEGCSISLILAYEVFTDPEAAVMLHPINALRNIARSQGSTPLLALLDVDMLVSKSLYEDLSANATLTAEVVGLANKNVAFVLPAFETFGNIREVADVVSSGTKDFLISSIAAGLVSIFRLRWYPQGHNATNYRHWFNASDHYQITYSENYEPWTIVSASQAPWHDIRFRGYGFNKIVHLLHMNYTGTKFFVLPKAFIIHRNHKKTAVYEKYIADKKAAGRQGVRVASHVYTHTRQTMDEVHQQLISDASLYKPVLRYNDCGK